MLPGLEGLVLDIADRTDSGVVDEDIESSKTIPDFFDRLLSAVLAADVLPECNCFVASDGIDFLGDLPNAFGVYVCQNHARAFNRKNPGRLSAQTLCGTGNQSDLVFDTTHAI